MTRGVLQNYIKASPKTGRYLEHRMVLIEATGDA